MGEIRNQTLKGVKWSAVETISTKGAQFLIGLVLARLLTPEDYGLVGVLGIFFAVTQSFIDSGFSNALIRKLDRTETDFSTVFYFNIIVGALGAGILCLAAPWIADFFAQPILKDLARVLSINLFLTSLTVVHYAKLTIDIDFKTQAKVSFSASVISGLVAIWFAWKGHGVWSLAYQMIGSTLLKTVFLWAALKWKPLLKYSWESFRNLFSYGSKLLFSGLLHTVYNEASTILIGKFYTPTDLGNYSRGGSMANLPVSTMTGILQRVTFPIFSRLQEDDEKLIAVYRKYIALTSMGLFFMTALLAALAKPLVLFLLTAKWLKAVIFLQVFCFAVMFDHICQLNLNLLQVKGRSDLFLRLEIIKKTISMAILLASIPFGVLAMCASKVLYTQIAVYINTYYTGKLFGLGYKQQIKDFAPYLILSLLSCSAAFLFATLVGNNLVALVGGTILAASLYVAALYLKKDDCFLEYVHPVLRKLLRQCLMRS